MSDDEFIPTIGWAAALGVVLAVVWWAWNAADITKGIGGSYGTLALVANLLVGVMLVVAEEQQADGFVYPVGWWGRESYWTSLDAPLVAFTLLGGPLGALLTLYAQVSRNLDAVTAASVVGVATSLLILPYADTDAEGGLLAIYMGAFVGMTSPLRLPHAWQVGLAGLVAACWSLALTGFITARPGGKMGFTAFLGVSVVYAGVRLSDTIRQRGKAEVVHPRQTSVSINAMLALNSDNYDEASSLVHSLPQNADEEQEEMQDWKLFFG